MYEPFEQAIDRFRESRHTVSAEEFEKFLSVCETCKLRKELHCTGCASCGNKSIIRIASVRKMKCPRELV